MSILDRELQRKLLNELSVIYPSYHDFTNLTDEYGADKLTANLFYLYQHNLITESVKVSMSLDGISQRIIIRCAITEKGMDFLEDDGGLTAILGVVTFKIDSEQLKYILIERIDKLDLQTDQKQRFKEGIMNLPSESMKHLTMKFVDKGLENTPSLLGILQSLF